jgi:hypothetical protein
MVDPELVFGVRPMDRQLEVLRQIGGGGGMVDVGMGDPDLLQLQAELFHGGQNALSVSAWVDHGGLSGHVIPDQRAVLLKGCDWDGEVFQHGDLSGACSSRGSMGVV